MLGFLAQRWCQNERVKGGLQTSPINEHAPILALKWHATSAHNNAGGWSDLTIWPSFSPVCGISLIFAMKSSVNTFTQQCTLVQASGKLICWEHKTARLTAANSSFWPIILKTRTRLPRLSASNSRSTLVRSGTKLTPHVNQGRGRQRGNTYKVD